MVGIGQRGSKVEVPVIQLLMGTTIAGGCGGKQKPREGNQELVEKYVSGKLPIDPLITHRLKLDQINDGFDLLKTGKSVRTIIEF